LLSGGESMERCPTCGAEAPCPTCGDSGDLSHLGDMQEEIQLGQRAVWSLHAFRRKLAAGGKAVARDRVEEFIRGLDDLIEGLKELGIH
jgi:hypothetical protein